jgi:anthranilate synthase/aminodeoxychorismate synthase-like glutamine amidotransferase
VVLLIDNYDSFTYNLYHYILQCGKQCTVVRNNEIAVSEIANMGITSIVISPGPEVPAKAGVVMEVINAYHNTLPILGICLGHQAIGEFFGAQLVKAVQPMHGKTSLITHTNHPIFAELPNEIEVMRYHSLVLKQVENTPLQTIAQTAEGEVMALAHPSFKLAGLQFHPESVLTPQGQQIMANWFSFIQH